MPDAPEESQPVARSNARWCADPGPRLAGAGFLIGPASSMGAAPIATSRSGAWPRPSSLPTWPSGRCASPRPARISPVFRSRSTAIWRPSPSSLPSRGSNRRRSSRSGSRSPICSPSPTGRKGSRPGYRCPDDHRAHRSADRVAGSISTGAGQARRSRRHAGRPTCSPVERDQAGAAAEATRNARLPPSSSPPIPSAIARSGARPQGLFEIPLHDPAPGLMEANQVDKKIRWSVRSSTGCRLTPQRRQARSYGRQNGLAYRLTSARVSRCHAACDR
jgi:hypothetical protein